MARTFWVETLGCPKNQVDSDKLVGWLDTEGLAPAAGPEGADLVVVNTCAFIEQARQESIDTVLALSHQRAEGAQVVVTGCLAERYGDELAQALPEVDLVAGFGQSLHPTATPAPAATSVPVSIGPRPGSVPAGSVGSTGSVGSVPSFDLLELPRPPASAPWAYREGGRGLRPSLRVLRHPQLPWPPAQPLARAALVDEVDRLEAREIVLVAQDLASYGRDQGRGTKDLVALVEAVAARVDWVRLLYLYPSELDSRLIEAVLATGVPVLRPVAPARVPRPCCGACGAGATASGSSSGSAAIRRLEPGAAFRSNFIVGYPGETEADHDQLLAFVAEAQLDWCGFFAFSPEAGTYAVDLDEQVPAGLVGERLAELGESQDAITAGAT